jgi:hypothetical protein
MKFILAGDLLINLSEVRSVSALSDDSSKSNVCFKTNENKTIDKPFEDIVEEISCSEIITPTQQLELLCCYEGADGFDCENIIGLRWTNKGWLPLTLYGRPNDGVDWAIMNSETGLVYSGSPIHGERFNDADAWHKDRQRSYGKRED